MHEKSSIETILDKDYMLGLNEKHITEGLDHKNLLIISKKYFSNFTKHRHEPADRPKH